jgi:hypothetical protein
LVSESPGCLCLAKMCVPGKAAVEMKSKVFYIVLLRYLRIIYMDRWARFTSRSERHMDRLRTIQFLKLDCSKNSVTSINSCKTTLKFNLYYIWNIHPMSKKKGDNKKLFQSHFELFCVMGQLLYWNR